jgi:hypothetical protein
LAIYTDAGGAPGTLVAQSSSGSLQANSWNTLPLSATLSANTAYWLMYNTNGTSGSFNTLSYNGDLSPVGAWTTQSFGTWPSSFGTATLAGQRYSIYATASSGLSMAGLETSTPTTEPVGSS